LTPESLPRSTARTGNLDAYSLYTTASAQLMTRTTASLKESLDNFKRAIELDSAYALAYAGLADAYNMLGSYDYGGLDPRYAYPHAKEAAQHALRLNRGLSRAHAALATVYANYEWNGAAAEKEFQEAIRLNNRNSAARQWYALLLASRARFDEAEAQTSASLDIDPASPIAYVNRAHVLYYATQFDSAAAMLDRGLALDPRYVRAHMLYAITDIERGRAKQAVGRLQAMMQQSNEPVLTALITFGLAQAGKPNEARRYAALLDEQAASQYVAPEIRALAAVGINDREHAFQLLDEAVEYRSGGLPYLGVEPMMKSLRNDGRFTKLVAATRR
jgi:serine/threonine-protein kinase